MKVIQCAIKIGLLSRCLGISETLFLYWVHCLFFQDIYDDFKIHLIFLSKSLIDTYLCVCFVLLGNHVLFWTCYSTLNEIIGISALYLRFNKPVSITWIKHILISKPLLSLLVCLFCFVCLKKGFPLFCVEYVSAGSESDVDCLPAHCLALVQFAIFIIKWNCP